MSATLKQIVQEFCRRTGLDVPNVVVASQENYVQQLIGLANEVIEDITDRGESWPRLQKQALFTSVATESQGLLSAIAPYGFKYLILDTIYDRDERRPIFGPRGAEMWQQAKALPYTGPMYSYRFWQGELYIQPTMPAGHTCAFEYASDMAILGTASATDFKKWFTADTDTFLLDESLLVTGLRWKWKSEKGMAFATDQLAYESRLAQAIGNDSAKGTLDMGNGAKEGVRPGIWVPAGNWNV